MRTGLTDFSFLFTPLQEVINEIDGGILQQPWASTTSPIFNHQPHAIRWLELLSKVRDKLEAYELYLHNQAEHVAASRNMTLRQQMSRALSKSDLKHVFPKVVGPMHKYYSFVNKLMKVSYFEPILLDSFYQSADNNKHFRQWNHQFRTDLLDGKASRHFLGYLKIGSNDASPPIYVWKVSK